MVRLTRTGAVLALTLLWASTATAEDAPWVTAAALVKTADADVAKSGIAGVAPHVVDLEKSLADGLAAFPPKAGPDGKQIILADGGPETLMVLLGAATDKKSAVALVNPYPEAAFLLALRYNENGQWQDALRVIDIAFRLKPVQGVNLGAHDAALLDEKAFTLEKLKRFDEALGAADAALAASQDDQAKAKSNRVRGYNLVELGRLDEAEAAYRESLKQEPDNKGAPQELAYIAGLKAKKPAEPTPTIPIKPN